MHAPAEHVRRRMPIRSGVEPLGEDRCVFRPGSDSPRMLAHHLGLLDADFEVVDAPELAARYRRAADRSRPAGPSHQA